MRQRRAGYQQLVHQLWPKNIEILDDHVPDACVPLQVPLRPHLQQRCCPLSRRRSLLCPLAVVLLVDLLLPGPGLRTVVRRCSQGHSERQLIVTPVHPQPSLPPAAGTRCAAALSAVDIHPQLQGPNKSYQHNQSTRTNKMAP